MDSLRLRPATPEDGEACGTIVHQAFTAIAGQHNFPSDFPAPEMGIGVVSMLLSHPGFYGVVAEREGKIVGSNFLDERSAIAGVGPLTISPSEQDQGVGRRLMQAVMDRADQQGFPGVRLLQAAYHNRSLALYSKLGFRVREPVSTIQGTPIRSQIPGYRVRPATEQDLEACNRLCTSVHGHHRGGELRDAIGQGTAQVVEREGRITGYTGVLAYFGHTVGETNDDLKALIGAAPEYGGPGFNLPTRNAELLGWCLDNGLRIVHPLTIMTRGMYNEPQGPYLPSILY